MPKGWLERSVFILKVACGVGIVALLALDGVLGPSDVQEDAYHYRCAVDNAPQQPRWTFPETRANPEAYWTAVAAMVGILALCFVWDQIRLSRATVDSYREAERGRLRITEARLDKISGSVRYTFINIGRSSVFIPHGYMELDISDTKPKDGPNAVNPPRMKSLSITLHPKGMAGSHTVPRSVPALLQPTPQAWALIDAGGKFLFLRGFFHYEDVFGKLRRFNIGMLYVPKLLGFGEAYFTTGHYPQYNLEGEPLPPPEDKPTEQGSRKKP